MYGVDGRGSLWTLKISYIVQCLFLQFQVKSTIFNICFLIFMPLYFLLYVLQCVTTVLYWLV